MQVVSTNRRLAGTAISGFRTMFDSFMTIGARVTLASFFVLLLALSGVGV